MPAGHSCWQGPMQSAWWFDTKSSRAALRERRISGLLVSTTMPSATLVEHAGKSARAPLTLTTHRKQEVKGSSCSSWHRVGMS